MAGETQTDTRIFGFGGEEWNEYLLLTIGADRMTGHAGIIVVGALDFHFRRMGDGILHAVAEGKGGGCAMGGAETEEEKDSILL